MLKKALIPIVALILVASALAAVTAGVLINQQEIPASGSVGGRVVSTVDVGVYSDAAATVACPNVNWGNIEAGSAATTTVYIKNTGNLTETLSLSASNWNPSSASSLFTLGWNREGYLLPVGAVVAATVTLSVDRNAQSLASFNFNIVISGSA
jgi:hypothetical protein